MKTRFLLALTALGALSGALLGAKEPAEDARAYNEPSDLPPLALRMLEEDRRGGLEQGDPGLRLLAAAIATDPEYALEFIASFTAGEGMFGEAFLMGPLDLEDYITTILRGELCPVREWRDTETCRTALFRLYDSRRIEEWFGITDDDCCLCEYYDWPSILLHDCVHDIDRRFMRTSRVFYVQCAVATKLGVGPGCEYEDPTERMERSIECVDRTKCDRTPEGAEGGLNDGHSVQDRSLR
jgi:hypothetical protein